MKQHKLLFGLGLALLSLLPVARADMINPGEILIKGVLFFVAVILVIGFIVGAVFLIRYIVRKSHQKIPSKKVKK